MNDLAPTTESPRRLSMRFATFVALLAILLGSGLTLAQDPENPIPVPLGVILPSGEGDGVGAEVSVAVRDAARQGIEMASDELGFNAELLGYDLTVAVEEVGSAEEAAEAAQKLADEGVLAIAGGYGVGVAAAIAEVAEEVGVPFLNIGSPSIALRNEQCSPTAFHVEPSGGMYLDALAGWYVGSGLRDWYIIADGDEESMALIERLERTLRERHFGARITGRSILSEDQASIDAALEEAEGADVVLVLARGARQIDVLARAEALDIESRITGFPWPETQTREYYAAVLEAAPNAGAGHRATAWEPTLDAYGARELNARFLNRFGEPMDAPAWATYQAVKLPYEAVIFGGARDRSSMIDYFAAEDAVFDVWKGIGVTFRPWNHQMRQTLFLVELQPEAEDAWNRALLVGELPAIYMPRTDPVERLDQLGDLEGASECSF